MSLRTLINLRILFSVVLALLLGGTTAVWLARQSVEKEVQSSINLALKMIEFGFAQVPLSSRHGSDWLPQISALQQTRHLQISISEGDDKPVKFITERIVNSSRSEPPRWFVMAVSARHFSEKYDVLMADGSVKTILITADPMDEISEAWGESQAFFGSIVAMLWIIFLTVNLLFNAVLRAVKVILSGLQQIEHGHYGLALPRFKIKEFDAIALEVNKMSSALKTAQESNQALARHTMHIQESERQTMSRELHDEMGQSLTAIKAMAVTSKQANADITSIADSTINVCNHLSVVVRSMMRSLHPLSLAELGLRATLSDLINEWQRRTPKLQIDLDYDDQLEQLDNEVTIHVYRIVQECLTNVVRHSQATQVSVSLAKHGNTVWITASDNGVGGEMGQQGFGVLGMRERAKNLGGKFLFESVENEGVNVVVQLPYIEEK